MLLKLIISTTLIVATTAIHASGMILALRIMQQEMIKALFLPRVENLAVGLCTWITASRRILTTGLDCKATPWHRLTLLTKRMQRSN